jgi:uncharacterized damage-inducible protein DinB
MSEPGAVCFLTSAVQELRTLKERAEQALAQMDDEAFFTPLDSESNSVAVLVKHLAGNMRSRWSDFLDSDGEKPDRNRDLEFEIAPEDTRGVLRERWEAGWKLLFETLASLDADDLTRTVRVRGEPLPVERALLRQLDHYAYHVGQMVMIAKHARGAAWRTLTIPRGGSEAFNARMREWQAKAPPGGESA